MNAYLSGLGATSTNVAFLDHALAPRPNPGIAVIELPSITEINQALTYALKGFHTSVDKGVATSSAAVKDLWGAAAGKYLDAYKVISSSPDLAKAKAALRTANDAADVAYARQSGATLAIERPATLAIERPATLAPGPMKSSQASMWPVVAAAVAVWAGYKIFSGGKKIRRPQRQLVRSVRTYRTSRRLAGLLAGG